MHTKDIHLGFIYVYLCSSVDYFSSALLFVRYQLFLVAARFEKVVEIFDVYTRICS
jgi:hypothetical protein